MSSRGGAGEYTCFDVVKEDGVAEVILSRPSKLNTMTPAFFNEVGEVFRHLDQDPDVHAILIWAKGRMFTAGLDLKSAASGMMQSTGNPVEDNVSFYWHVKHLQSSFTQLSKCKKPVIVAVHSLCLGGGVDLITAADIRLCTEDASFQVLETKIAIVADLGTLQRLSPIVGRGVAREMVFTSNPLNAKRALRHGLVNEVYASQEEMLKAARDMARKISSLSPLVVQGSKVVMNYADEHSIEEGLEHVALWNSAFLKSSDLAEAVGAFMSKREAKFKCKL